MGNYRYYGETTSVYCLFFIILIMLSYPSESGNRFTESKKSQVEPALQPLAINTSPGPEYSDENRNWQGIPGIERTPNGRLWATWYSGGSGEVVENYILLLFSDDDGQSWSEPHLVVDDPTGNIRTFDPVVWMDPRDRLWLFWAQSEGLYDGRAGVWAIVSDNPDAGNPDWSKPRRLTDGIMMNKPIVLSDGEWLLPAAIWDREPRRKDMTDIRHPNVYVSTDEGDSWYLRGSADVDTGGEADEHMLVERKDGSLWMLYRTGVDTIGIGEVFSFDSGRTWEPEGGQDTGIPHPATRFHIQRLDSGRLLLIYHYRFEDHEEPPYPKIEGRTHLTASLSDDDGKTWYGHLLLDSGRGELVTYPDAVEGDNGKIYVIYDRSRRGTGEILMAAFTEKDIRAADFISDEAESIITINALDSNSN